jgi:hypothetical protein
MTLRIEVRFNDLDFPEPIPKDTGFASVIESNIPIVGQHTRLDSRQSELALMTTLPIRGAFVRITLIVSQ